MARDVALTGSDGGWLGLAKYSDDQARDEHGRWAAWAAGSHSVGGHASIGAASTVGMHLSAYGNAHNDLGLAGPALTRHIREAHPGVPANDLRGLGANPRGTARGMEQNPREADRALGQHTENALAHAEAHGLSAEQARRAFAVPGDQAAARQAALRTDLRGIATHGRIDGAGATALLQAGLATRGASPNMPLVLTDAGQHQLAQLSKSERAAAVGAILRYSDDQERDDHGRFSGSGGSPTAHEHSIINWNRAKDHIGENHQHDHEGGGQRHSHGDQGIGGMGHRNDAGGFSYGPRIAPRAPSGADHIASFNRASDRAAAGHLQETHDFEPREANANTEGRDELNAAHAAEHGAPAAPSRGWVPGGGAYRGFGKSANGIDGAPWTGDWLDKYSEGQARDAGGKWSGGSGHVEDCPDHDVPNTEEHQYHEHTHRNPQTTASSDIEESVAKYSDDQARDDHGRWTGSGAAPTAAEHVAGLTDPARLKGHMDREHGSGYYASVASHADAHSGVNRGGTNVAHVVTRPFPLEVHTGRTDPTNIYYGNSQVHRDRMEPATARPGDLIHQTYGGSFLIPKGGGQPREFSVRQGESMAHPFGGPPVNAKGLPLDRIRPMPFAADQPSYARASSIGKAEVAKSDGVEQMGSYGPTADTGNDLTAESARQRLPRRLRPNGGPLSRQGAFEAGAGLSSNVGGNLSGVTMSEGDRRAISSAFERDLRAALGQNVEDDATAGETKPKGAPVEKYSDDQERDEHGRWSAGGAAGSGGLLHTHSIRPPDASIRQHMTDWASRGNPAHDAGRLANVDNAELHSRHEALHSGPRDMLRTPAQPKYTGSPAKVAPHVHDSSGASSGAFGYHNHGRGMAAAGNSALNENHYHDERGHVVEKADLAKYSDDQPRDAGGRWSGTAGELAHADGSDRAPRGHSGGIAPHAHSADRPHLSTGSADPHVHASSAGWVPASGASAAALDHATRWSGQSPADARAHVLGFHDQPGSLAVHLEEGHAADHVPGLTHGENMVTHASAHGTFGKSERLDAAMVGSDGDWLGLSKWDPDQQRDYHGRFGSGGAPSQPAPAGATAPSAPAATAAPKPSPAPAPPAAAAQPRTTRTTAELRALTAGKPSGKGKGKVGGKGPGGEVVHGKGGGGGGGGRHHKSVDDGGSWTGDWIGLGRSADR